MKKKAVKKLLSAVLAAAMVVTSGVPAASLTAQAAGNENSPVLTVDMSSQGRALKHGATGWLYGQGDDQVPTSNMITPLKPNTAVQKAPNGMQHPNGDVLDTAKTFLDSGGKHIQIYVPDYYALWFYEFTGTEYYLEILKMQAQACIDQGIQDEAVYVLYNEPSENWVGEYHDDKGNKVTGWNSMFWFWNDMVNALREVYRENGIETEPKTAGLNLAGYNNSVMEQYIKFCVEHSCMPQIISWHDLSTWQFNNFGNEYNHYRSLEAKYLTEENQEKYGVDITPREIVINEYADRYECASPGNLVRWIGLFEDYDVAGCLPFWHFSNNLNGLAADNNEGSGAWWLFKWYGDMSGSYLNVQTSNAEKSDFYGAASIDENKKSANVIFGGKSGNANIVLDNLDSTQTFGEASKVHVKVEATDYTGFHGVADEPRTVKEGAATVENGTVTIPMSDMNSMSGYRVTVTQASDDEAAGLLGSTWKSLYEAEDGILGGNAKIGSADQFYACSNRKKVDYVDTANDSVTLNVSVPKDGYYKYDMVYSAATGVNTGDPDKNTPYTAIQTLTVDGNEAIQMELPNTLHWSMGGMYSTYLKLTAGNHTLKIAGSDSQGKATPDCVYLTYKGTEEEDTRYNTTYEAELGEFNELKGEQTTLTTVKEGARGYITGLGDRKVTEGGGVRFNVVVPENGMYTIALNYSAEQDGTANIYIDNDAVNLGNLRASIALVATGDNWMKAYQTVFLQKGINILDIDADGSVNLDYVNVRLAGDSQPVSVVEAESGELTGAAAVGNSRNVQAFASEGGYVSGIKAANSVELIPEDDPDFTILGLGRVKDLGEAADQNSLVLHVNVPEDGAYKMAVYQSSGELFGKHDYNAQMTERYASFSVNGGEAVKYVFRNTYSDETFRAQVVDVNLKAGDNTIRIFNDNSKVVTNGVLKEGKWEHRPENIDYGVLTNYTPNFDKIEIYKTTGETAVEENTTCKVTTKSTDGGQVNADRTNVQKGEDVILTFTANQGCSLTEAFAGGESIMDQLTADGGIVRITDVQKDMDVQAYYEVKEYKTQKKQLEYVYAVNAGDTDPSTVSPGDSFGLRNTVTDQFYGEDASSGYKWGVVDTYVHSDGYPNLLTGEKTWPCENDGATDASPKSKSFRYARNQRVDDIGVVYQFDLDAGVTYDVELGYYVPGSWTNAGNPRTMKLTFNNEVIEDGFKASNDSNNPYIIKAKATPDENGQLVIQTSCAANAVWGPVISYINIMNQADTNELQAAVDKYYDLKEEDYDQDTWTAFASAYEYAEGIIGSDDITMNDVNNALYDLELAVEKLEKAVHKDELDSLFKKYEHYEEETGQGITSDEDWNEFLISMENAAFILNKDQVRQESVEAVQSRLENAADKLNAIARIEITKTPDRMSYYVGDGFDPSGLVVTAEDTKGNKKVLADDAYTLSGYDFDTAGTKEITVSYMGKSAAFTVEVSVAPIPDPVLRNITAWVNKAVYMTGEAFDKSSLWVTALYSDGTTKTVSDYTIAGFDSGKGGKITLTIGYQGYTANVDLYIQEKTTQPEPSPDKAVQSPKVKASSAGYNSIQVKWNKVSDADGYVIYRSTTKKGKYNKVKTITKGSAITYKDTRRVFNRTYYYKVKAYKKAEGQTKYSDYSNIVSVKTKVAAPVVTLKKSSSTRLRLSWKKVSGASGYQIAYSTKKSSGYQTVKVKKSSTGYTIKNLKKGKTYYVKVRGYRTVKGKKVNGSWSAVKSIKLK